MKRTKKTVLTVYTINIYSQSIKEEKSGYASLNVNGAGEHKDWPLLTCSDCLDT
jgi:hypothetical protein